MGYTEFYQQIRQGGVEITWKDIFSEYKNRHGKKELEYALLAGTSLDSATEETMLQKWRKPWVFYPLLKGGLALVAFIYASLFVSIEVLGIELEVYTVILTIIPPLIIPMILMVFIWELNIPRNISIYELFGCFLVGGISSLFGTGVMFGFVKGSFAPFAAFREEPAKLAASLALLYFFSKKKKVYGLTGLVVGAAVGAGFGGFESVSYAQNAGEIGGIITNQVIRGIFALGGHTVYCAPYIGAVALEMKDSKITLDCFKSRDFLVTFASSVGLHFLWNSDISYWGTDSRVFSLCKNVVIIILLWIELLYIARKCLHQAVLIGQSRQKAIRSRAAAVPVKSGGIRIECVCGPIKGAIWRSAGAEVLTVGRNADMKIRISGARGVSLRHCSIQKTHQGWTVRDLNSSYGTFTQDGQKLMPGIDHVLHSGEVICLAGKENAFRIFME